jgi:hypothetical protein
MGQLGMEDRVSTCRRKRQIRIKNMQKCGKDCNILNQNTEGSQKTQ